jgi:hypothetical protein
VPGSPTSGNELGAALAIGDFAGDGIDDLAVGVPGNNGKSGAVLILTGQADASLTGTGSVLVSQNTTGITGTAETGDRFGSALGAGTISTDNHDDLVVGVPGENGSGAVAVLHGSPTGFDATTAESWTQNTTGIAGTAEAGDGFGTSIAVGQLDADTPADVAVGVPGDRAGTSQHTGGVHIFYGQDNGLSAAADLLLTQNSPGTQGTSEASDRFGESVAILNIHTTTLGDLLVGAPHETIGSRQRAGAMHYIQSSATGLTTNDQLWTTDTTEVKGTITQDGHLATSINTMPSPR